MSLVLSAAAEKYPITSEEVIEHLRMCDDEADAMALTIDRLIADATAFAEDVTWRALITQTWNYYLDTWPGERFIVVPKPPLQSAKVYYTVDGAASEVEFTDIDVDVKTTPGRIVLETNEAWPTDTLIPASGIRVALVAGYGDDPEDVPIRIRQAMLLHTTMNYDGVNLLNTINAILANYRIVRW